jgi:hypothetical protein
MKKVGFSILLLFISFNSYINLVDTCYPYTFEADSEHCIEETRPFYFFFKNPVLENAPHPLNAYPNYSDGEFIATALLANIIAPLCKSGIIKTHLSDADNSLFIFSMRWAGVCFDTLAVMFVFLSLMMLTQQTAISFLICLLYYLFNQQTLTIDLIRIDHYIIFSATFCLWASLLLYYEGNRWRSYILCGIATGLISATKINFPFYLLLPVVVVLLGILKKNIGVKYLGALLLAFFVTSFFLYFRWFLYAENIVEVLRITVTTGEEWVKFWGTGNCDYYLWDQFFITGNSTNSYVLLLLFYTSFVWCCISGLKNRNDLKLILCIVFIVQMAALAISPKVGRYGIILPVYVSVFIAISFNDVIKQFTSRLYPWLIFLPLLIPVSCNSFLTYQVVAKHAQQKAKSIKETRLPAARWIQQHFANGFEIAIQPPPLSNPPIFDLPYTINSKKLQFSFLHKDILCNFLPPSIKDLKQDVNAVIINDKERNYHLLNLRQQSCDSAVYAGWQTFYNSLPDFFPEKKFESDDENYGVKAFYIYLVNDTPKSRTISPIKLIAHQQNGSTMLEWNYTYSIGNNAYRFQIQIAEDSAMQWLVYGSRDGYISKYRTNTNPVQVKKAAIAFTPPAIQQAYAEGKFLNALGSNGQREMDAEFENFFAAIALSMKTDSLTFGESMKQLMHGEEDAFISVIKPLYQNKGDILNMHLKEYLHATRLGVKEEDIDAGFYRVAAWNFLPPLYLAHSKKYYCRVRFRDSYQLCGEWSNVCPIISN